MDTLSHILLRHQERGLEVLYPLLSESACIDSAQALLSVPKGKVLIVTGFFCFCQGETDGPLGSHFLALALKELGYQPILVTDKFSSIYFSQENYPLLLYDFDSDAKAMLTAVHPTAMIAIERCGRARDARYYSMKKKDISDVTPPADELFLLKPDSCVSIGIGDGGNEIGMGNYSDSLEKSGKIIPSCVRTEHTIVATVSNWGAYGLIAAMEKISGHNLLPSNEAVSAFLRQIVRQGAPDGIQGPGHCSTDGFGIEVDFEILEALRKLSL